MKKSFPKIAIVGLVIFLFNLNKIQAQGSSTCLKFNGIAGHVKLPGFNFGSSNFSIETWVKVDSLAIGSTRIIVMNGYQGLPAYFLAINSLSEPYLFFRDASGNSVAAVASGMSINDNKWHHITAVRNNTSGIIYLDGVKKDSISTFVLTSINTTCSFAWIGATNTSSFSCPTTENALRFLGEIDELRFWDKNLTQIEIQQNMCKKLTGTESNLVGYWRFDDAIGGTVIDGTGLGNNGTLY